MASLEHDEVNLPWGKFSYTTEGLATTCYMEGISHKSYPHTPDQPAGKRLLFRVELPARCFVLSVAVKLPNAPQPALYALDHIEVERSLKNGEYETVYDGYKALQERPDQSVVTVRKEEPIKSLTHCEGTDSASSGSPTSVDQSASSIVETIQISRKKVMEVRRAADTLRLTLIDVVDSPEGSETDETLRSLSTNGGSDNGELRILGVVVVGYVRGQTPAPNRLKVLLDCSAKLGLDNAMADRAEVDALLGLAILGHRRYRQAAELLQRASELTLQVAKEDAESGFIVEDAILWAAELNLLSAHAYFEHIPMSNDGIIRLVQVADASNRSGKKVFESSKDIQKLSEEFLDLRTELLCMLEDLVTMLVHFLGESNSLAVKLASTRMLEFICEQLGCAIARHMGDILNQVLRSYSACLPFGARERAAAASFAYDSMEDCFERLIDICCRLFPLTEHTVLLKIYEGTLIPVFLDGFHEADYLHHNEEEDAEEAADELMTTAVAQTLRVIYLALNILSSDARVPSSLLSRLLNILVTENGNARTPLLLRRAALHAWDAVSKALIRAAKGSHVKVFGDHLHVLQDYLPSLLFETRRTTFQYKDVEDEGDGELEITKEEYVTPTNSQVFQHVLDMRNKRIEIVDRHTLRRLIQIIRAICDQIEPTEDEEGRSIDITLNLLKALGETISALLMSSLIDVSYHEAAASGNGEEHSFEFGQLPAQIMVVSDILTDMFNCFWSAVKLLPVHAANDVVRSAPVRAVLGWCVDRMSHSAPPKGMLRLLSVTVKGLQNDLNSSMYDLPAVPSAPHEATFLGIYRAVLQWLPQTREEETFDLLDVLHENVSDDFMANDLALLVKGLGDQGEQLQARTEVSLELVAEIVASNVPKRLDLALSSLKALEEPRHGSQRIANGFPSSSKANSSSYTRRMHVSGGSSSSDSMEQSFYLHVVLASCFDLFDALGRAASRRAGPSFMGEKIDAFVEHAALCVRCLHACARKQRHRGYVGAKLGDIFGTCLAMQDHGDSRVRLAGFEIFAASLDVLFLAQRSFALLPEQHVLTNNETAGSSSSTAAPNHVGVYEYQNGSSDGNLMDNDSMPLVRVASNPITGLDFSRSMSLPISRSASRNDFNGNEVQPERQESGKEEDAEMTLKIESIFSQGGSCAFYGDDTSNARLNFEERGWQVLCHFVTASLGIGKYVDFVVQRACLEYLKACMMNALRGRSSGARVIAFEHIELLWEAVNRLIGSPWRTLNALAMWVVCTILNVGLYSSVMPRKRGLTKQRGAQLSEFLTKQVFPRAESMLKHGNRETRIWGMRLLEVYIRARDMNGSVLQIAPPPPGRVVRCLDRLKHDWCENVQEGVKNLLNIHYNALNKKGASQVQSFTAQAQSFMTMRRYHLDDLEGTESNQVELWFPPLPKQVPTGEIELYCRTLEAFANTEIEGGEETELSKTADAQENDVEDDGDDYEDELEQEEVENEDILSSEDEEHGSHESQVDHALENSKMGDFSRPSDVLRTSVTNSAAIEAFKISHEAQENDSDVSVPESLQSLENTLSDSSTLSTTVLKANEGTIEDDEDHEFPAACEDGPKGITQSPYPIDSSKVKAFDGSKHNRTDSDGDYLEEEEEVVNVTDEDDVLVDVESVPAEKKMSLHSPQTATPKPELNPDLDEGRQVLRRKGSFTSRPSAGITIEEGDAPRLARRRSMDIGLKSALMEKSPDLGHLESESSSQVLSPRLLRRKSLKSPTSGPRISESFRNRSGDQVSAEGVRGKDFSNESGPSSWRFRRKSSRGNPFVDDSLPETRQSDNKSKSSKDTEDSLVGHAFLGLSPKHAPRGIKLDEDINLETRETRPQTISQSGHRTHSELGKSRPRSGPSARTGRRLPRAPAFVKGGGPQRRMPAPLPIGCSTDFDTNATGTGNDVAHQSRPPHGDKSSADGKIALTSNLGKLLPIRGTVGKSRLEHQSEDLLDRVDKSHRYSRREPRNTVSSLPQDFDPDIIGDQDLSLDNFNDIGNQVHVGTPTATSSAGRKSLADDEPSSSYKRRSKRSIADSMHFKSLLDQFEPVPNEDDAGRVGPSRQLGKDSG
ncbi:unnamed protein product [Agarophyton chilense]|eukprot:gb/GEZJ01001062.1/.p1 GENE.gb/GEZJ01001062.1/~~gb/GEZJ01001062.1/.p1  ORF type:complete len:2073 (-),score=294.39 gb/GEZJ01001062.1/:205-6423(-)